MSRAPSFALADAATSTRRRGEWLIAIALTLALLAQLGWLQRDRLAANATLRPLLGSACNALGCTLPPWREPSAFTMLARDVIAAPERPGVLRVQASFRNDARWPQPWPTLALTLADMNGRPLGARRFLPEQYFGDAPHAPELAPGQAGQIAFDIVEPAPSVVAFDFRFE